MKRTYLNEIVAIASILSFLVGLTWLILHLFSLALRVILSLNLV